MTPFVGVAVGDEGSRTYRLGGRMQFDIPFSTHFEVTHREDDNAEIENSLMLRGSAYW